MMRTRALLFDLDGTLLDTAPDMAAALAALRREQGYAPLAFEQVRPMVSHGAVGLVRLGFPDAAEQDMAVLRKRFVTLYAQALAVHTRLFDGMEEVLADAERRGLPWGVVTNKPAWLTDPLLDALQLSSRAACVVSGDTLAERKPHPMPMLHAAAVVGVPPADCVYVGDAARDIEAGRAAGMRTIVAAYGYISADEQPSTWQADAIVGAPAELHRWLLDAAP